MHNQIPRLRRWALDTPRAAETKPRPVDVRPPCGCGALVQETRYHTLGYLSRLEFLTPDRLLVLAYSRAENPRHLTPGPSPPGT
jgi:hypothetical protein